jgi:hypothetical protein
MRHAEPRNRGCVCVLFAEHGTCWLRFDRSLCITGTERSARPPPDDASGETIFRTGSRLLLTHMLALGQYYYSITFSSVDIAKGHSSDRK